ncbi:hypothetical protein E4T38_07526 [Aureobasidium subglaciale]|nr:hypothetical protein E4T38_07526 [Aureobasidium subglaciale]KAI5217167.1 hypothetical protein E4T40_07561 [Aureobasidium subglaciale]KAI5220511.1 hypothetical protein E4T41_07452 [Aureobasidium subglaciale]KAI5258316.1 hypothetical protein E4T46_07429 [Aureobasidium subglaciale]
MNELFFVALYLLAFAEQDLLLAGSQMNTLLQSQPWSAGAMGAARASKIQSTVPKQLMLISIIPMLIKQIINIQQLIVASQWLAEGDVVDRAKRE